MIKIILFSFLYHVHTSWSKEKYLIWFLRSLRQDLRVKMYFFFVTYSIHYAMIRRKTFFFISALRSTRHCYRKRNLIFTEPLLWLRYDYEKIVLFLFHWDVHDGNIFLHDLTSITTSLTCWKKFPDGIVPGKGMCNLKNFFLRKFSGVFHDLLPRF